MKRMILSFKIKGDVISDHFLMLWFQKDSLASVWDFFLNFTIFFCGFSNNKMLKNVKDIQTQSFLIFIIFKDLLDTFNL